MGEKRAYFGWPDGWAALNESDLAPAMRNERGHRQSCGFGRTSPLLCATDGSPGFRPCPADASSAAHRYRRKTYVVCAERTERKGRRTEKVRYEEEGNQITVWWYEYGCLTYGMVWSETNLGWSMMLCGVL